MATNQKRLQMITIEGATIGFKNFSGLPGQYNTEGNRNFNVFLDPKIARELEAEGWNIRWLKPRDENDEPQPILPVKVEYKNRPPKVVLISGKKQTLLTEDTISILDFSDIAHVDVKLSPYAWTVNGKSGIKAYLKLMYAVLAEDEFAQKYEVEPDSALSCILGPDGKCID